ncbi:MAG: 30S ribosomal protein S21 [Candidatus Beckwithbacteria bacterium]|nr:30S ribosomal protein S21 [Patescibacteria group bacterium]
MPIVVKAQPGDSSDQVIRKFKKKILQSQLLTQLKEREFHKKPSVKKKEKMAEFKRLSKRRKRLKWVRARSS